MTPASSPSCSIIPDALAVLASVILDAPRFDYSDLRDALRAMADSSDGYDEPNEWTLKPANLFDEACRALRSWPPHSPNNIDDLIDIIRVLQKFDRWHLPLNPAKYYEEKTPDHLLILEREIEVDRFNENLDIGSVIRKASFVSNFDSEKDEDINAEYDNFSLLCSLMEHCSFIPASVLGPVPDGLGGAATAGPIKVRFRRIGYDEISLPALNADLRISIAPGVENSRDANLWQNGDSYTVMPIHDPQRLRSILKVAIFDNAHILLMPEMSVREDELAGLPKIISDIKIEFLQSTGVVPALSMCAIGVISEPKGGGDLHRNYIAVISTDGRVLLEQEKLTHWNLSESAQKRFGLDGKGYAIPLIEHTVTGKELTITEIENLGRVAGVICADMSHDMPVDWILENIGLDGLYAPIMDGSTCWAQGDLPWIISRAVRFSAKSGATIAVTNSMSMTCWNNEVLAYQASRGESVKYKSLRDCGIGFFVRKRTQGQLAMHVTATLGPDRPVVKTVSWRDGWSKLENLANFPKI